MRLKMFERGNCVMAAKRILWMLNHKTLMQFEVPLLRTLGYEVYIPKIPSFDVSVAVDWESDKFLTIPAEDLEVLNQIDFYERRITPEEAVILNRYFQTAMMGDTSTAIESMVDYFQGMLVLRAYGLHEAVGSYTDRIISELGLFTMTKIENLGARFVFGEAYRGLSKIECRFFQDHTLYMPIGLADAKVTDRWTGEKKKALFVCPRIKISGLYEEKYKKFKKDFKGIPYAIGGVQPIAVESDPKVLGNLPKEEYETLYTSYRCLFSSDQEKNWLAYPPLEAVRSGMPLVFMAGGMLDKMGGKDLPGRCASIQAARTMVSRLVNGDKALAGRLRKTQGVLLEKFTLEYCMPHWQSAMEKLEERREIKQIPLFGRRKKRVAVVLPEGYTGGVLDYSIGLARALKTGIENAGDPVDLVFAHVEHQNFERRDFFKPLRDMGIPIRSFSWQWIDPFRAREILGLKGIGDKTAKSFNESYIIPQDGIAFFADCDFLLFTADRVGGYPLLLQPYGVISHDFVQRYVPQVMEPGVEPIFLQTMRRAKAVFTTTSVTAERAAQYAGISKDRIHLIPLFFATGEDSAVPMPPESEGQEATAKKEKPYFIWSTNSTEHKMHLLALEGLMKYYDEGGSLLCRMTGAFTELLSPKRKSAGPTYPYCEKVQKMIESDKNLLKNIKIMGQMPKGSYERLLAHAAFIFHPGTADNGNMTSFDAAYRGVPTLSNDYQAMRYYEKVLRLNIRFFDVTDEDSVAQALLDGEQNHLAMARSLPSRDELFQHSVYCDACANEIYRIFLRGSGLLGSEG